MRRLPGPSARLSLVYSLGHRCSFTGMAPIAELKAQKHQGKEGMGVGGERKESKPIISSKDKHPIFFPSPKINMLATKN